MCWYHKSDFLSYDFRLQRMKFKISKKPKKIYSGKRSWETKRWKRTWRTYINGLCSKWRRLTAKHGRASKEGLWIFSFLFFFPFSFSFFVSVFVVHRVQRYRNSCMATESSMVTRSSDACLVSLHSRFYSFLWTMIGIPHAANIHQLTR